METNDHAHTFDDGGDKRDPRTFQQLVRELLGTLLFLQQVHNSWLLLIRTMRKLKERSHLANLMDLLMTRVLMSQNLLLPAPIILGVPKIWIMTRKLALL